MARAAGDVMVELPLHIQIALDVTISQERIYHRERLLIAQEVLRLHNKMIREVFTSHKSLEIPLA